MLRLLPFSVADGATQMAADEAMLESLRQGLGPPSLRFYQWQRPTLSLGFHQRQVAGRWQGLEQVRRPTGGRAVWHQGDLTYALAVRDCGSTAELYRRLCQFLLVGLAKLGIALQFGRGGREYVRRDGCFSSSTSADLTWQGRKLIGSAQVRRAEVVLQHGTLLLQPDREQLACVFAEQGADAVVGLVEIRPDLELAQLVEALVAAWGEVYGSTPQPGLWSAWERGFIAGARGRWQLPFDGTAGVVQNSGSQG